MRIKLLFDQNISYRVIEKIKDLFPDSSHVARIGNGSESIIEIY